MPNTVSMAIELEGKDALRILTALNKSVKNLGETGTKSFKTMDLALGSFVGNLGAQAVLKSITLVSKGLQQGTKDALDFGKAIAEVNSIVPRTATETLALKQQLISLSNEFGDRAQNQAKAFYNILSAGVTDTTKALNTLEVANKAAVAGLVDVDTAARGLLSVTNSYTDGSVDAAQAADILFVAVKEGRTTFGELADTIGRVASISSSAKVGFDEVAGALAFVTKSGIKTDEAVIGLRGLLTGIIGPTDQVKKAAKDLGIEWNANALEAKGLRGLLNELSTASGGNVEKIRALIPNVRAFAVAIKIAGGDTDDFNRILDETADASGAADKAFKVITDSAGFQFEKLVNQLKNFPLAILTNFEEPISDALKAVNEFIGGQGILLIADAVDGVIAAFQFFNAAGSTVDQVLNFIAAGALNTAKAWSELALTVNKALQSSQEFLGLEVSKGLKDEEEALNKRIKLIEGGIEANERATLKIQEEEQKRFDSAESFRKKIEAGRQAQIASEDARREEQGAKDKAKAEKDLAAALGAEENKFNAIQELKLAQKEQELELAEQEKIEKELAGEEEFQFLVDNLGREATLKELARIKEIDDEKKRQVALKKLRDKARKEEQAGIFSLRKFEDLTNREKIAAQKSTLGAISALSQSSNGALFAIGKASSLALAGINVAEGVTKALAAFPPPFNFAAAAAVGAAGAINISKIASAKKPSAGNFQSGGIIDVPGGSQSGDQLTAGVNNREGVFNLRQQKNLFRAVDQGNLGRGSGGLTINNPVFLDEGMIDTMIDKFNDRVENGNKNLTASEVA